MKKSPLIAAAIAATLSGAVAADTTFGGNIRLKLVSEGELALESGKLTMDIKSSEDLGNGMTGIARIEWEHDNADRELTGLHNDLSYVGIKGDFGQLTLGVQDDAAGFACGATDIFVDNSGNACSVGSTNGPLDNAIVYVKGIDALTFVVGLTFDGNLTTGEDVDGAQPAPGNHSVLAANYAGDGFSVGFQFTSPDSDLNIDDWMVLGGSVMLGEGTLGLTVGDNGTDNAYAVAYAMPLAGGTVKVGVDQGDALANAAGDDSIVNLEFDKKLGKSTYAGVQVSDDSRNADTMIQAYMGYKY